MAMIPVPLLVWRVQVYSTQGSPYVLGNSAATCGAYYRLQENITGQRVVKAFARKQHELDKFEKDNLEPFGTNVKTREAFCS